MKHAGLLVATLLGARIAFGAQETNAAAAGESYVVKEGDTLESLAERYLGSAAAWTEIWKVNSFIKDPHRVFPGQSITIPKNTGIATIDEIARRVDSRPHTAPVWAAAHVGDPLGRRDGLRTYRASSAQLGFKDGSQLTVGEDSLIFVRDAAAPVARVSRNRIEIVEGQGDLSLRSARPGAGAARSDIEVVVGSAHVAPTRATDGTGWSRARVEPTGGRAQLMVFKGQSEVTSGGRSVTVQEGMGTSVVKNQKPAPPQALLPAPQVAIPSHGAAFDYANPRFVWRTVAGAGTYVMEVCEDPACSRLVARIPALKQNEWTAEGLPVGAFYWRVTACSAGGLDGYPSEPRAFTVKSLWRRPPIGLTP